MEQQYLCMALATSIVPLCAEGDREARHEGAMQASSGHGGDVAGGGDVLARRGGS